MRLMGVVSALLKLSLGLSLVLAACGGSASVSVAPSSSVAASKPTAASVGASKPAAASIAASKPATSAQTSLAASAPKPSGAVAASAPPASSAPGRTEERSESAEPSGGEAGEGPPKPNPLAPLPSGGNPEFAPVPGVDHTKNGAAAGMHGNPTAGQSVFTQNCVACHAAEGKGGIPNPGSEDSTVPPLNPIDPGFKASAKGDPGVFAREIDLFIQHGSRPDGSNPVFSMPAWGDGNRLTQQQIADVEAYVMQLNGLAWPNT